MRLALDESIDRKPMERFWLDSYNVELSDWINHVLPIRLL